MFSIRNSRKQAVLIAGVIGTCLLFQGCTSSQVITTLETIVDGASVATTILASLSGTGALASRSGTSALSDAEASAVLKYLQEATTAASQAISEWDSTDSKEMKVNAILAIFSNVAAEHLAPTRSVAINAAVQIVAQAIELFLREMSANKLVAAHAMVAGPASSDLATGFMARHKLHAIRSKADSTTAKLIALSAR